MYGRVDHSQPILVPQIKEILRIQTEPEPSLAKKAIARKRKRSQTPAVADAADPEKGWDDTTTGVAQILSYPDSEVIERRECILLVLYTSY